MKKIFRIFAGFCFLLFCVVMSRALFMTLVVLQGGWSGSVPIGAVSFLLGVFAWFSAFLFLPRPVTVYVFAHEMTHAVCAFFSGESVKRITISGRGGAVSVSGSNFLVALAPYFFPFYTVLVVLAYYILWLFVDPSPFEFFWIALIGATWCFHVTFTVKALMGGQPDIKAYGFVFSYGFICFMNILVVCAGLIAVSSVTLEMFTERISGDFAWFWRITQHFYNKLRAGPF